MYIYEGYVIQRISCEGDGFTESCWGVYDMLDNLLAIRHSQGLCEKFVDES
jgi:hypothetical protein